MSPDDDVANRFIQVSEQYLSTKDKIKNSRIEKHKSFEQEYLKYLKPPVDVLPTVLKDYINQTHKYTGLPKDYILAPMLPILGTAIGKTYYFFDDGPSQWEKYPCFWTAIVCEPSVKKSAAINPMLRALKEQDDIENEAYIKRYNTYKEKLRQYKLNNKNELPKSIKPLKQIIVKAFTYAKLVDILRYNKKGILIYNDEIAKLFKQANKYDKGQDDNESILELRSQEDIRNNIKGYGQDELSNNALIKKPLANITGTIQPSKIRKLLEHKHEDGFTSRFCVVYPDFSEDVFEKYEYGKKTDMSYADRFTNLMRSLVDLQYSGESHLVRVQDDAVDYFNELHKKNSRVVSKYKLQDNLRYMFHKSAGYIVEVALILQIVKHYAKESQTTNLELSTLQSAEKIVDYFNAHYCKLWANLGKDVEDELFIRIKKWILKHNKPMPIDNMIRNKIFKTKDEATNYLLNLQNKNIGVLSGDKFYLL